MKRLLFVLVLAGCTNAQIKSTEPPIKNDSLPVAHIQTDTALISIDNGDPYQTGKDTIKLNAMMDSILKFPEVEIIDKLIRKASKGRHGVAFIIHDNFNDDSNYYYLIAGDNSHEERFENIYHFVVDKKTWQIKAYDITLDSIMNLQDWRRSNKLH